jgi:hypothetical protein
MVIAWPVTAPIISTRCLPPHEWVFHPFYWILGNDDAGAGLDLSTVKTVG